MTRRSIVIFGIVPGLVIAIAGLTLNYVIEWSYPSGARAEEQVSGLCSLAAYLFSLTGSLVHLGSLGLALFSYFLLAILKFCEKDGRIASLVALTSFSVFVGLLWARSYNLYAPCFPELAHWFEHCRYTESVPVTRGASLSLFRAALSPRRSARETTS